MSDLSPQRRYAEHVAVVMSGMGLAPAQGKLFGWLLVAQPPWQTSAQLATELGLSKGSVSTGMRALETAGLAHRVPLPGRRGHAYEVRPDAIIRIAADPGRFRVFRELMAQGVELAGGERSPGAERLVVMRDFYAFIERELPRLVERFEAEYGRKESADG
ncbi:GbsR/MarR family transcriptional regulator [Micromonospora sp. MS34]|uniref:GbsR/MarR family transcriptional regulator n=1 Tax=Micromonospora sp. MS34 TaxID=3385971 RepID=UPI00399F496D